MGQDPWRGCVASARRTGTVKAEAKTEQGWQGRNRRRFEDTLGGKEGGCGEDGTRQQEGRWQEGGGEEGTRKGGEESWREGIAEESGGEGFRVQSDRRAVEAELQIGRPGRVPGGGESTQESWDGAGTAGPVQQSGSGR